MTTFSSDVWFESESSFIQDKAGFDNWRVHHVCMYAYFYWHLHDLGHVYVDTYPHFPNDFLEFSKFFWFLQWFKNLLLYI